MVNNGTEEGKLIKTENPPILFYSIASIFLSAQMRVHSQLEQYFSIILVFSNKYKPNKNLARQKKIRWFIKSRW